jgi:hypothetical protein
VAFNLIAHTGASSGNTNDVTTSGINTTGADLLVVAIADYAPNFPPLELLTDSNSNVWSSTTGYNSSDVVSHTLFKYVISPVVGSGHTFTLTTLTAYPAICVAAFSGVDAGNAFDAHNGNGSNSGITSFQTGSISPDSDNELLVAALSYADTLSSAVSIDSSFTIADEAVYNPPNGSGDVLAYKIQTSAASENPTWSWTGSTSRGVAAAICSFRSAGGGGFNPNTTVPTYFMGGFHGQINV